MNSRIYTPCTGSPGEGDGREESKGREYEPREVKEGKKEGLRVAVKREGGERGGGS